MNANWLWLIPGLPLLGSLMCGILHFSSLRSRGESAAGNSGAASALAPFVASGMVALSFALSIAAFSIVSGETSILESGAWSWIPAGSLSIDIAMSVDRLSGVMLLVVTGVGFLIHVYSAGYMKGDPGYAKFFAYLNLFVFAMLILVLSSSLLGLFIGWEGVGLCSYLLIGFWYQKGWPSEAGQKAFVVNRIGDACFLIGTFVLVRACGSLDVSDIVGSATTAIGDPALRNQLVLAALLLFGGAIGKSAQIPLFVWLPDAMAGPTPVSALIHAATMVTAGIYLVARMSPLYALSESLMFFIALIGATTALVAGSAALVQRDIKKVLAYSTVSQLGYMFLALGCGAWAAAIFHLVTHAFFKALLFLGAGSVIHGMHEEQDMHRMGGLRRHMPATFKTFLCGAAALSGLPLLSGFFSKDEILAHTWAQGGAYYVLWGVGILTAALTALYTWRMVALTFFGKERFDAAQVHPHESPSSMTVPLWILAFLAVAGGVLGLPLVIAHLLHVPHLLGEWLAPTFAVTDEVMHVLNGHAVTHLSHAAEWVLLGLGSAIALAFAHHGFRSHVGGVERDERGAQRHPKLTGFLGDAWGFDKAYAVAVVQPVRLIAFVIAVVVDQFAIDGMVNATAEAARGAGRRLRRMADGNVASYGLWMGAVTLGIALFWMWTAAR